MAVIGIDLGTTNSLVSIWQNGESVLIPNEFGEVLTPSIISVEGENLYVGKVAKERMVTAQDNSVRNFKRDMGKNMFYHMENKKYTPQELSALILKKLKEDAEEYLGEKITEAVISVPAYFDDSQRYTTKHAGELAGLKVERLINEPSAAALFCRTKYGIEDGNFLVFDFGGGTLDISIVECFQNVVNVLAVCGDNQLGGSDFDFAIAKELCRENQLDYEKLEKKIQSEILFNAEQLKWKLSKQEEGQQDFAVGNRHISFSLNRKKLVDISSDIFKKIEQVIQRAISDSEMEKEELTNVILVGGSSKMPVVKQYVKYLLGKMDILEYQPDEIVGLGVGIYVGIKERKTEIKDIVITDVCPFSLGTGVFNSAEPGKLVMDVIIPRNTPLPVMKKQTYCTVSDYQKNFKIDIYQGENYYAEKNLKLGETRVPILPKKKEEELMEVFFTYDINGILIVMINIPSMNRTYEMVIDGRGNLTEEQKQKRIQELADMHLNRDLSENKLLVERAKRMYEKYSGTIRKDIVRLIASFERAIDTKIISRREFIRNSMKEYLDQIEQGQEFILENEFDEKWYQEGEEK